MSEFANLPPNIPPASSSNSGHNFWILWIYNKLIIFTIYKILFIVSVYIYLSIIILILENILENILEDILIQYLIN